MKHLGEGIRARWDGHGVGTGRASCVVRASGVVVNSGTAMHRRGKQGPCTPLASTVQPIFLHVWGPVVRGVTGSSKRTKLLDFAII